MADASRDNSTLIVQIPTHVNAVAVQMLDGGFGSEDSVGLAWSGLSVGHDHSIKAIEYVLDHWIRDLIVSMFLFRSSVQHLVKKEVPLIVIRSH